MSLFFNYSRPGPGVAPDEPRKTGLKRIWEMIARDYIGFWLAGVLNLLLMFPIAYGAGYACATHSLLFAFLAGIIGGTIAAPGFYGLADTLLRSLRDEPGFWWHRYSRALRKNWKSTLFPGALMGTVYSVQFFILMHMRLLDGGLGLFLCQIVSMVVSTGIFVWALPQQVLLELSFASLVKNSLLLFFRYFFKTIPASLLLLVFAAIVLALFPNSIFLLLVVGLWLPMLCCFQIIYPTLDDVFDIENSLNHNNAIKNEESTDSSLE